MPIDETAVAAPVSLTNLGGRHWGRENDRKLRLALSWAPSRHGRSLLNLVLASLALAVVTRRPELVALAAPGLVLLGTRSRCRPSTLDVQLSPSTTRVYEGEQVALAVSLGGADDYAVGLLLHPSTGARAVEGYGSAASVDAELRFEATLWGRRSPGTLEVALWDSARVFECHRSLPLPVMVCYPRPAPCRTVPALGRLANRSGDHRSRSVGDGSEFSGVREYVVGDRQRSINWPATTRRGRLQVNTFAAERSQDLVLIVDATSDMGELGSSPVDYSVRGAVGVAQAYLDARDRVGLVLLGGQVSWLAPGTGKRQVQRILEMCTAARTGWVQSEAILRLPRAVLPPGAAVVAFSPLLEVTFLETLRDLRQRGVPVVVVDVLTVDPPWADGRIGRLAKRLHRAEREALLFTLRQLGITIVSWDGRSELALPAGPRRSFTGPVQADR